jgi:hypothetical protein
MADQNNPDPTEVGELAQQIVATLINVGSVSRQRAIQAAMLLLGETKPPDLNEQINPAESNPDPHDHTGLASFFSRQGDLKPSDYAQLCAAYHYSLYGTAAFSLDELRAIATEAGVVIPDRVDMTLNQAIKKGKKLFLSAGKGSFRPTATAGLMFGERWDVKPGRRTKVSPKAKEK